MGIDRIWLQVEKYSCGIACHFLKSLVLYKQINKHKSVQKKKLPNPHIIAFPSSNNPKTTHTTVCRQSGRVLQLAPF